MVIHLFKITTALLLSLTMAFSGTVGIAFADDSTETAAAEPAAEKTVEPAGESPDREEQATDKTVEPEEETAKQETEAVKETEPEEAVKETEPEEAAGETEPEEAVQPENESGNEEIAAERQAEISLIAIGSDNSEVKWLENRKIKIEDDATVKSVLSDALKETGGRCDISDDGVITSITGPAEYGFANQKLDADKTFGWIVSINGKRLEADADIGRETVGNNDCIAIEYAECSKEEPVSAASEEEPSLQAAATDSEKAFAYGNTKDKILSTYDSKSWGYEYSFDVIGLSRAGYFTEEQGDAFYDAVVAELADRKSAVIDSKQATENAKTIIALTAIGKDPTDVGGYNLLEPLADYNYVKAQGVNGMIWALIAFDSGAYEIPELKGKGVQTTREKIISAILSVQHKDGGWAYGGPSDIDMTAMTIQALTPYYKTDSKVKAAVDKALKWLSANQDKNGFFTTGVISSESQSQVIIALTGLGIDPEKDRRFVKNGKNAIDALLSFYVEGGGFKHVDSNWKMNGMATSQGNCALVAYYRFKAGKSSLYQIEEEQKPFKPDIKYEKDKRVPKEKKQEAEAEAEEKKLPAAVGKSITKVITVKVSNLSGDAQKALELIRAVSGMKLPEKGEDYSEAQIKQINEAYSAYAALETAERLAIEKDKAWKKFTKATDALGAFYHLDGKTGTDIRDSKKKFLPWYVRLVVSETSLTGRQQTKILKLLGEGSTVPAAYNIRLVNTLDNTAWKPDGIINVKMQIPNMADPDRLVIIHIGKSGRIELINGKVSDDRKQIAFDTAEFSVFALAVPENSVKSLLEPEEEEVNFLPWCFGGCGALALALLLLLLRRITDRA